MTKKSLFLTWKSYFVPFCNTLVCSMMCDTAANKKNICKDALSCSEVKFKDKTLKCVPTGVCVVKDVSRCKEINGIQSCKFRPVFLCWRKTQVHVKPRPLLTVEMGCVCVGEKERARESEVCGQSPVATLLLLLHLLPSLLFSSPTHSISHLSVCAQLPSL